MQALLCRSYYKRGYCDTFEDGSKTFPPVSPRASQLWILLEYDSYYRMTTGGFSFLIQPWNTHSPGHIFHIFDKLSIPEGKPAPDCKYYDCLSGDDICAGEGNYVISCWMDFHVDNKVQHLI